MEFSKKIYRTEQHPLRLLIFCNRFLTLLAMGFAGYILINLCAGEQRRFPSIATAKENMATKGRTAEKMVLPPAKPFAEYLNIIRTRDIFKLSQGKSIPPANQDAIEQLPTTATQDWAKDFKLVGILLDKEPKAVIEDVQINETIFLSHGQQLREAVLQEIQEDKVIFVYQGRRVELTF